MDRAGQLGLAAFVPADVRAAIALGEAPGDVRRGAVLEADVSGFTPLTESLAAQHGPRRGAEEVAAILDRVYGALVAEVDRAGGTVVEFGGDSIVCCFDGDDGAGAVRCGLAMQDAMAAPQRAERDAPTIKVAVAAGVFHRFSAGDPDVRLLEVLAGPAVARLAAVAPSAGGGEVVVDAATARRLGPLIAAHTLRGSGAGRCAVVTQIAGSAGDAAPAPAAITLADARPWLPSAVLERLREGGEALLGELRSVVALFIRFGRTEDADAARRASFDAYVRFAHGTLDELGGTLFNISVDGKGTYLCAGFGALVAHDDDPQRAAAAALALVKPPAHAGGFAPAQIGIAAGRLYAGTYGGLTRRTFGLQGSTANLAARLMQSAAPGQILVEEQLAQRLATRFELRALDALTLKGRAGQVAIRELAGIRSAARPAVAAPRLVDRAGERGRLDAIVSAALGGDGGLVVLEGEPGIGKSRLLGELVERAAARGLRVLRGAGDPIERGAPYHGWRPVFDGTLDIDALSDADASGLSGGARAEATRDLLADTLGTFARDVPTLVVLEDAHWLDSASLALALRLASTPGPLGLVLSTRPLAETATTELERVVALPRCERLTLGPLLPADALELAAGAVGVQLSGQAAELVAHKGGGNPLFTRELAFALRDHGLLGRGRARGADDPSAAPMMALHSPDSVEVVIAGRVDRLPTRAQAVLKVASVLGLAFAEDALRELVGAPVDVELELLEDLELLTASAEAPAGGLAFRHALIRDVVYERLLHAQRRDLHRQAATYLEGPGSAAATHAARAYHWDRAGDPEQAARCLGLAGEQARRAGAGRECAQALERALELTAAEGPSARRAHWHFCVAQACYWTGELKRSLAAGEHAIAARDRPVPARDLAAAAAVVREIATQLRTRLRPRRLRDDVSDEERERLLAGVDALFGVAEVYYHAGDPLRSTYVSLRSLNLAERLGPTSQLAHCYGAMTIISGILGRHRFAERYAGLAQATAAEVGDPHAVALTNQQITWYRTMRGPHASWAGLMDETIDGYRRLGNKPRMRDVMGSAGTASNLFGRHADCKRHYEEVLTTMEPQEVSLWAKKAPRYLGSIALRRGDVEEAVAHLHRAQQLTSEEVAAMAFPMHALLALASWRAGHDGEALRHDLAARACAERLGRRGGYHIDLDAIAALAELALAQHDEARSPVARTHALRRATRARALLRRHARAFVIGKPMRLLYEAELQLRRGRRSRALRTWRRGLAAAQARDMLHEQRLLHAALGDQLAPGSPEREHHRRVAADALAQDGAAPSVRAVAPRAASAPAVDEQLAATIARLRERGSRAGFFTALLTHVPAAIESAARRDELADPGRMLRLHELLVARHVAAASAWLCGEPPGLAWSAAFGAGERTRGCIAGHVLLGMNAHVAVDLPVALADALPDAPRDALRADFEHASALVAATAGAVVAAVAGRSPLLARRNPLGTAAGGAGIDAGMRAARLAAWSRAEELEALSGAARTRAIAQLDALAARRARTIAHPGPRTRLAIAATGAPERGTVAQIIDDIGSGPG